MLLSSFFISHVIVCVWWEGGQKGGVFHPICHEWVCLPEDLQKMRTEVATLFAPESEAPKEEVHCVDEDDE